VAIKIGAGAPLGAVFKSRRRTGEVLEPNAPGRDPIVTRILWLKGLEPQNRHAFARCIYIHGTPEERNVGHPASFGCVRMKSVDMLRVFNAVGIGATVEIVPGSLPDSLVAANNPRVVSGPIAGQVPPLPVAQAVVVSGSTPAPPVVTR
jgi:L,D-transpeptidase-like protein